MVITLRIPMKCATLQTGGFLPLHCGTGSKDVREEYDEARSDLCIVHYAGPDNRPGCILSDLAGLFCFYARRSP